MNGLRKAGVALVLGMMAMPLAAQLGTVGETFLGAVREQNGSKAMELINGRGSTVLNYRGAKGETALHVVTRARSMDWLAFMLGKGADPDVGDAIGDTPLAIAARLGFVEGARTLIGARAKVDLANRRGETPLIIAVQQRQPVIVRLLLEAGADPSKTDHAAGFSARDYAKQDRRSTDMLKLIDSVKPAKRAIVGPSIR